MQLALIAVAMLAPNAGAAGTAKPEIPTTEASAPAVKEEKKICKKIDSSDTRLGSKKVCMTAKEWRKAEF